MAIIDSGIRKWISDLRNRIWVNWAERNGLPNVDDDGNGYIDDSLGWNSANNTPFNDPFPFLSTHGTHIAAIIGSETDSTNYCDGIAGINWGCRLMNVRVDSSWYCGDDRCYRITSNAVGEAIWYAAKNGAKVINISLGFQVPAKPFIPPSVIEHPLIYADSVGAVSVAAIGNIELDWWDFYPGVSEKALGVGATTCNDNRVTYELGLDWASDYSDRIDLVAPGLDIYTTVCCPGHYFSGTSASTPMVSGIASLVITHRKKLIPGEVLAPVEFYEVLRHTADDTVGHTYEDGDTLHPEDTPCFDKFYGWGRANAFKALVAVSHGDVNNDSQINATDITYLINFLFKGGPPPVPVMDMADANCDKRVSIADTVFLVNYLFKGGSAPSLCYTDCSQP